MIGIQKSYKDLLSGNTHLKWDAHLERKILFLFQDIFRQKYSGIYFLRQETSWFFWLRTSNGMNRDRKILFLFQDKSRQEPRTPNRKDAVAVHPDRISQCSPHHVLHFRRTTNGMCRDRKILFLFQHSFAKKDVSSSCLRLMHSWETCQSTINWAYHFLKDCGMF